MLNFYLRRGSKSPYSHLEYFPGEAHQTSTRGEDPFTCSAHQPPHNSRLRRLRTPMSPFMHAFGVRIGPNLLFLGYAPACVLICACTTLAKVVEFGQ